MLTKLIICLDGVGPDYLAHSPVPTLDELLGAIQIEAAAMDSHYADLTTYYANIFRLEALTGAKLVNFAP